MVDTPTEEGGLLSGLGALLESGAGADVTLVVGGCELPAHSLILALRSPVFAAALRHDMQEARTRRIEIADMRVAVLRQLLHFAYTDTTPEMDGMVAELLSAADKYDMPLLKKRCEQKMAQELTVENAAAMAVLAELHSCPMLKRAAADFVASNPQVMGTDGWINAMRDNVEAAAQICKQVAAATPSSRNRILSEERKKKLMEKLFKAAQKGSVEEVWALLDAGAPIDGKDGSGNTALHLAVQNNHAACVKFLIDAGADVNARDKDQWTPLHYSVYKSDIHIMWTLLAVSADKDARNKEGETPLHVAGRRRGEAKEHSKALLLAGANRDIKDNDGCSPNTCYVDSSIQSLFNTN